MEMRFAHSCRGFYLHHIREDRPNASPFTMQIHDCCELHYSVTGRGTFYVEGNAYPLYPGCVMVIRPGEAHTLRIDPQFPYERIVVEFAPELLQAIDPDGLLAKPYMDRAPGKQNQYAPTQLNGQLVHEALSVVSKGWKAASKAEKDLLFYTCVPPVLLEIYRAFARSAPKAARKEKDAPVIGQLIEYINLHLCEELTLDSLAERFFMNKMHLNKLFKGVTGSTIWEYIVLKRLMMARQFIREGMTATAAAAASGWKDYSAFYRSYKAHFHITPSSDRLSDAPTFWGIIMPDEG